MRGNGRFPMSLRLLPERLHGADFGDKDETAVSADPQSEVVKTSFNETQDRFCYGISIIGMTDPRNGYARPIRQKWCRLSASKTRPKVEAAPRKPSRADGYQVWNQQAFGPVSASLSWRSLQLRAPVPHMAQHVGIWRWQSRASW